MKYSFHAFAKIELKEATHYYETCQKGLGDQFLKEIRTTIQRIIELPEAWTPLSKNTRRCLTKRFPYGIIYQIENNTIFIIAIMQMNREPNYWKNRIM